MRDTEQIMNDFQRLCTVCKVLACCLDECCDSQFHSVDFAACLHLIYETMNSVYCDLEKQRNGSD